MQETVTTKNQDSRALQKTLFMQLETLEETLRTSRRLSPLWLGVQLTALRGHIGEYSHSESQSSWTDAVLKQAPQLEHAVQQLIAERRQLQESLDTLLEETEATQRLESALIEKVLRWIANVREHEAREEALLEEAFTEDLGAGD